MGKIAEENPDLPFSVIKDILIAREEDAIEDYALTDDADPSDTDL